MGSKIDLIGQTFGRWLVVAEAPSKKYKNASAACWECVCDCGTKRIVKAQRLTSGRSTSCGCHQREELGKRSTKHGLAGTKLYDTWKAMVRRCTNPRDASYTNYGGRGITVCDKWKTLDGFLEDMEDSYQEGLEIERIDNSLGYCKENCKWTTDREQARNRRSNVMITFQGRTQCLGDWATEIGIGRTTLVRRIENWGISRALTTPPKG